MSEIPIDGDTIKLRSGKLLPKVKSNLDVLNENIEVNNLSSSSPECANYDDSERGNDSKFFFVGDNNELRKLSTSSLDLSFGNENNDIIVLNSSVENKDSELSLNNSDFQSFIDNSSVINGNIGEISVCVDNHNEIKMALDQKLAYNVIPDFDGSNVDFFLSRCDFIYKPLTLKDDQINLLLLIKTKFIGPAFEFIKHNTTNDWKILKDEIRVKFLHVRSINVISRELGNIRQEFNEPIQAFALRIEKLLSELNDAYLKRGEVDEAIKTFRIVNSESALDAFVTGIRDSNLQLFIKSCRFTELSSAVQMAINEEKSIKNNNQNRSNTSFQSTFQNSNSNKIQCQFCQKIGHTADVCFSLKSKLNSNVNSISKNSERFSYGNSQFKPIHNQFQNPVTVNRNSFKPSNVQPQFNSQINNQANRTFVANSATQVLICNYCHKVGHHLHDCRKRIKREAKILGKGQFVEGFSESSQQNAIDADFSQNKNFLQPLEQNIQNAGVRVENL